MKRGLIEFLLVVLPKAVGGFGTIALNIVLIHFLGGEEAAPYGIYCLCVAGILMADGIFGTAFDMAVLRLSPLYRTTNPERSRSIERVALGLKTAMIAAVATILTLAARPLSVLLFNDAGQRHLIYISCAAAAALLLLRSAQLHFQVDRRFHLYGLADLLHHFLKFGGIGIVLAWFRASPANVLAWFAIAPGLVFVLCMGAVGRVLLLERSGERRVAGELLGFIRWFLLTFFITTLVSKLDILLLPILTRDLDEVGIFGGGLVFTMIPEVLGIYISVVLNPRIMPYFRAGRFVGFFERFQVLFTAAAVAMFVGAWLSMGFLREHVLPDSFARSARILMILLPGALAAMVSFPLTISFLMFVRPRFLVTMECILLAPVLLLYVYAIGHHGAVGAAWVTTCSRFLKAVISQYMAWRWAHLPPESVERIEAEKF